MIIYLVRHGQTDWNKEKRMQGHRNIPMNEAGVQQINDLADRIVEEGISFNKMIASPLDRARYKLETIEDLCKRAKSALSKYTCHSGKCSVL